MSFAAATGFVQRVRDAQKDLFLVKYQFEIEIVIVDGQLPPDLLQGVSNCEKVTENAKFQPNADEVHSNQFSFICRVSETVSRMPNN